MTDYCSGMIVGVLDIRDGQVVRAIAGERARYRLWKSPLTNSSDPLEIAGAFRQHYQIGHLYLADLDAIAGKPASWRIVQQLLADGFHVTLDAGPRHADDIERSLTAGVQSVVVPLETLPHRCLLSEWICQFGSSRLAFGLDLADGVPLAEPAVWDDEGYGNRKGGRRQLIWRDDAPLCIARDVVAIGIPHLIVLDLRRVGGGAGPTTAALCAQIRRNCPNVVLWTGGGVRDAADIDQLRKVGADRVMVASLLHEETLGMVSG